MKELIIRIVVVAVISVIFGIIEKKMTDGKENIGEEKNSSTLNDGVHEIKYFKGLQILMIIAFLFYAALTIVFAGNLYLGWFPSTKGSLGATLGMGAFAASSFIAVLGTCVWKISIHGEEVVYRNYFGIKKKYNFKELEVHVLKSGKIKAYRNHRKVFTIDNNLPSGAFFEVKAYQYGVLKLKDDNTKLEDILKVKTKEEEKHERKLETKVILIMMAVTILLYLIFVIVVYNIKNADPYDNLSYIHESADNISDEYHKIEGLEALLEYYSEEKLSTIDQISVRAVAEAATCAWQQCDNEKMPAFKVPITNDCDDIRIINADMSRFPNAFETLLATDFLPLASEEFKDAEYIAVEIDEVTGNATVEVIKKDEEYSCIYTYTAEAEGGKYYLESAYWIKLIQSGKY